MKKKKKKTLLFRSVSLFAFYSLWCQITVHKCEPYPQWSSVGDSWEAISGPFISKNSAWRRKKNLVRKRKKCRKPQASAKHQAINVKNQKKIIKCGDTD